jgi:hypothetical protein
MKTVNCTCAWCKKEFAKSVSEYNRSRKKGKLHFCSLNCSASNRNTHRTITPSLLTKLRNMSSNAVGKNRDQYTPFRYFKRRNNTHKHTKTNLTLQEIKEVWDRQNGMCRHTGISLMLPDSIMGFDSSVPPHKRASLDRIDNTKGYTKDNVHFVSYMSNLAKNKFDESCVIEFIKAIKSQ